MSSSRAAPGSPASSSSSSSSGPGGGVRLADFSPPGSYIPQPVMNKTGNVANQLGTSSGNTVSANSNLAMENSDVFGPSSSKKMDKTTPRGTGCHGKLNMADRKVKAAKKTASRARKAAQLDAHADSDSDDADDVFSPDTQDPSSLFNRLSLSGTSTKASGKMPMTSNNTTASGELRPKRSVAFKDEADMALMTTSPAAKLGERRSARRGDSTGSGSGSMMPVPLRLDGNLTSTSGRDQVSAVEPQHMGPPGACVFVANLPLSMDDDALEAAVTRAFREFGLVFVKIRRDENNMPFAFCQYMTEENAIRAMQKGKGKVFQGRACRTEMLKATRTFAVSKRNGSDIAVDEAHDIMEEFGDISKCERLRTQNPEGSRLPPTILVEFSMLNETGRDLDTMNTRNPGYNIELFDARKKAAAGANPDKEFLRRYDINRRSIYISGFPLGTTQDEIARHFSLAGRVLHVDLKPRRSANGRDYAVAFVEFEMADAPDRAIAALNESLLRGFPLKVQRKEVGGGVPKRVPSENQLQSTTTPERPNRFHALVAQHSQAASFAPPSAPAPMGPMTPGVRQAMLPVPPMTPSSHHAQAFSPVHWPYQVGHGQHSPMMFPGAGHYSPSGYMQNTYSPGAYGGSVPTTPSGYATPQNPYALPANNFLPGPGLIGHGVTGPGFPSPGPVGYGMAGRGMTGYGMAGPGFPNPGPVGPGLAGRGLPSPGMLSFQDEAGNTWVMCNPSPAHGDPQSSGMETPTRSGAGRGMGRGQGGGDNTH